MDRRFLTVLGVSLVFALVVASIFYQITARAGGPKKADVQPETRDVVVAVRPLAVGVTIKPADLRVDKIVPAAFPKGAFSKMEEVVDRSVIPGSRRAAAALGWRLSFRRECGRWRFA